VIENLEITRIETQLKRKYLLWIHLAKRKSINANELRTIRLDYIGLSLIDPVIIKSFFNIPRYHLSIITGPLETFVYIALPEDYRIEVSREHTCAYNRRDILNFNSRFRLVRPRFGHLCDYGEMDIKRAQIKYISPDEKSLVS